MISSRGHSEKQYFQVSVCGTIIFHGAQPLALIYSDDAVWGIVGFRGNSVLQYYLQGHSVWQYSELVYRVRIQGQVGSKLLIVEKYLKEVFMMIWAKKWKNRSITSPFKEDLYYQPLNVNLSCASGCIWSVLSVTYKVCKSNRGKHTPDRVWLDTSGSSSGLNSSKSHHILLY